MTTDSLEQAAQELVDALMPLLDNADGYDKSTVRTAFLAQRPGDVLRTGDIPRLLVAEEVARHAWKSLTEALLSRVAQQQEKVTRVELIDHRNDRHGGPLGRAFVAWDCAVELAYQDAGRTLKVFVTGATSQPTPLSDEERAVAYAHMRDDRHSRTITGNPQFPADVGDAPLSEPQVSGGEPSREPTLDWRVECGATALWKLGNERIGYRPWESVAAHYRQEAAAVLSAADLQASTPSAARRDA